MIRCVLHQAVLTRSLLLPSLPLPHVLLLCVWLCVVCSNGWSCEVTSCVSTTSCQSVICWTHVTLSWIGLISSGPLAWLLS